MTHRVINFAPGPAALPLAVLERAREDLLDYQGTGISILEHTHRGKHYAAIHAETKRLLVELLGVPDDYEILFMQGGARGQFAFIPMNLLRASGSADYVITGTWGQKAIAEARIVGTAREAASTQDVGFTRVPNNDEISWDPQAAYAHITSNNTIYGTQFFDFPDPGDVPLVVDMSSDIAWRPTDVSGFGLIYAGAQKNLGIPGVTLVIIRKDLVEQARTDIPEILRYRTLAKADSLQNTAPTFAIYMMRNVLDWVKAQGGLAAMEQRNRSKAELLYGAIEATGGFYSCPVEQGSRSVMNVIFRLRDVELEERFVAAAAERNMVGVKGHRSVGGMRVSLYNAISPDEVRQLTDLMDEFADQHG